VRPVAAQRAALVFGFAVTWLSLSQAAALIPPPAPTSAPSGSPTPEPQVGAVLPAGAALEFVLDNPIDSKKTAAGTVVPIHLRKALIVNGTTLAPAGAPASLKVISTRPAVAPDVDGSVRISLEPLALPNRGSLPVRAIHEYITIELTAGQESTNSLTDAAKDIFIPGHVLYKNFRKGRELTLPSGSILRALTGATIDASNPAALVITTPPPFVLNTDEPYAAFTPIPLFTVAPPTPRATASPKPKPTPTLSPAPAPTATP
jgi:hypothetical protein